jgi:transcription elongation factor Elf1
MYGQKNFAVMTTCPDTGKQVSTGIICDRRTFQNLPGRPGTFHCGVCGQQHSWSVSTAWLSEIELDGIKGLQ